MPQARSLCRAALFLFATVLALLLTGCDFDVQPLGAGDGRTQVYVAAGKLGAPNAGIICTRIGVVVIDPMLSPSIGQALDAQANAKSRIFWDTYHAAKGEPKRTLPPPVLYVLNTTWRASHTFGNQAFDKADVISTPAAKRKLEAEGRNMREELRDQWRVPGLENHYTAAADLTVDGTLTLDTPEVKIQFVSMGDCVGEGDAVVYLPGQRVLFAGDMVLAGFIPYHKGRTLTVRHWISQLKVLEGWEIETVVPGHGPVSNKAAIKDQREFLEALVAAVGEAIGAGQSEQQAVAGVRLPKYSGWRKYDEWFGENVRLVYRELKAGEAAPRNAGAGAPGAVQPAAVLPPDVFRGN